MKKLKYLLVTILAAGSLCSCNDWLTVVPDSVAEVDKMMQTDIGIQRALTGIYVRLSRRIYNPSGRLGGISIVEKMAASYDTGSMVQQLGDDHVYPMEVEDQNTTMFIHMYEVIANCNALINGMEPHREKLNPTIYNIVRGEALAIRALMHFNLICIYGPVPYNPDPAEEYLPYVKVTDVSPYPYNTFDEFMGMVLDDLNEAEQLLEGTDPIVTQTSYDAEVYTSLVEQRKSRVNYFGVLALQARVRHYLGRTDGTDGSLAYAKKVIGVMVGSNSPFRLSTPDDFTYNNDPVRTLYDEDRTHYSEHLAGVSCETYDTYDRSGAGGAFNDWNPDSGSWPSMRGSDLSAFVAMMTKNKGAYGTTDTRFVNSMVYEKYRSIREGGSYYTTGKWMRFTNYMNSPRNFPIIRLAELYFIAMEAGTLAEANQLYDEYCTSRSTDYVELTDANREKTLLDEFIREFYGESQNFFRYKRTGERQMWFSANEASEESYRLPLPERERLTME